MSQSKTADSNPPGAEGAATKPASCWTIHGLGAGLLVLGALLVYFLLVFWPGSLTATQTDAAAAIKHLWWDSTIVTMTLESRLIVTVMLAGALGSFVHVATSFSDFVGNRKLSGSWVWWYILRPFVAMALAAIFYFVIRGGFLNLNGENIKTLNLYGIVAIAGLVGMFSKQATDKLGEVFDTMFRTGPSRGDSQRKDSLDNPQPTLSAVQALVPGGGANALLMVRGTGFVSGSVVRINGAQVATDFVDAGQLKATLPESSLPAAGALEVMVSNPRPGGGDSAVLRREWSTLLPAESAGAAEPDACGAHAGDPTPDDQLPAAKGGVAS